MESRPARAASRGSLLWKVAIVAGLFVVAGVLFYMRAERRNAAQADAGTMATDEPTSTPSVEAGPLPPLEPNEVRSDATAHRTGPNALVVARWGSHRDELGRDRPQEGNPEGPMSLVLAGDQLLVLDQVNGRLARYSKDGKLLATSDAPKTAQDIAVGKDGTVAMIDRLVEKTVTLVDSNGKKIGELSLAGRVPDPGLVTAVIVDGKDVYVEKEHGSLVLLGTTDGKGADQPTELTGRPSKDGALLLTAGLSNKEQGRAYLNAVDRKTSSLRFARAIAFPKPALGIVLLDTDAKGTIYLGVASGDPGDAQIACLDPGDGHVVGRVTLPLSHTAEESFRDFTVGSDGTIAFAVRTDEDIQYRTARCP